MALILYFLNLLGIIFNALFWQRRLQGTISWRDFFLNNENKEKQKAKYKTKKL